MEGTLKRLFLLGLLILASIIAVSMLISAPSGTASPEQRAFKEHVRNAIGTLPMDWSQVIFDEIGQQSIRLTLVYRNSPSNLEQVQTDTQRIARSVLKVLIDSGRNPRREMITVFVHGQIPEKGETGASLVRSFGRTMYDYNNDQLTFKQAKN
jgi:hypothetical protein